MLHPLQIQGRFANQESVYLPMAAVYGPGIEKHRVPKLFTPFYSKRPHGTGIGLSFCKRAIEVMGGKIHVTSELGKNTTFIINLPNVEHYSL